MDDAIRNAFLQLFLDDRTRGVERSVEEYVARFEGHEEMIRREHAELSAAMALPEDDAASARVEALPASVGPYHVLERIGSGGMGDVFLAEQREPLQRLVAVKVIKLGMDTREVIARFDAERQALAMMDHPNIARVFDAGATTEGRPFFVMEFVRGSPITELCDRERLDVDARLDLFLQVCEAVQHAHQRGVIHRDLKPSNVLVAIDDGQKIPKVIDFGIAKATDAQGQGTLHTEQGRILGTPEYMSPEQAGATSSDVDTRSDVYSLGCLLYELLTGAPPFVRSSARDYESVLRALREDEAAAPSARVAVSATQGATPGADHDGASAVVQARSAESLHALQRRLRGDLDWILIKALEKDRERRYASAADLAADLRRYRAHEPVSAGPPSTSYRVRKFVRRHRTYVAAALFALTMLVAGLVVSLVFWMQAIESEAEERAARRIADIGFRRAQEAVDKMLGSVGAEDLRLIPRMERVRRRLLEEALLFHKDFLAMRGDDPTVRFAAARAYQQSAGIHRLLGEDVAAREAFDQAQPLLLELIADEGPTIRRAAREQLGQVYYGLGNLHRKLSQNKKAREYYERCVEVVDQLISDYPESVEYSMRRADLEMEIGDPEAAVAKVIALADREPPVYRAQIRVIDYLYSLGETYLRAQRFGDAVKCYERARRRAARRKELTPHEERKMASVWMGSAVAYMVVKRNDEALDAAEEAERRYRKMVAEFPDTPGARKDLAKVYGVLALLAEKREEPATQRRYALAAIDVLEGLVAAFPWVPEYKWILAIELGNFGNLIANAPSLQTKKSIAEAIRRVERSVDLLGQGGNRSGRAYSHLILSDLGRLLGDATTIETNLRLAAELYLQQRPGKLKSWQLVRHGSIAWVRWAMRLLEKRKASDASAILERALRHIDSFTETTGQEHEIVRARRIMLKALARAQSEAGEHAKACEAAKKVAGFAADDWTVQKRAAEVHQAAARAVELEAGAESQSAAESARARSLLEAACGFAERACAVQGDVAAADAARCHDLYAQLLAKLGRERDAVEPFMDTLRAWRRALAMHARDLARDKEAVSDKQLASAQRAGKSMIGAFTRLSSVLTRLGDARRLASSARALVRTLPKECEAHFAAACAHAAAFEITARAGASSEAEPHAKRALESLRAAVDTGLRDVERFKDRRLNALRAREDFGALVKELGKTGG